MKSTSKSARPAAHLGEVSIITTLARTAALVVLTVLIAASARFLPPVVHLVQHVAGTQAWQSLYTLFGVESGIEREQLILIGIVLASFCVALAVQLAALALWTRIRSR